MPTIYRPDTDAQRLKALETAKGKADVTAPADLAISAATLARVTAFLPTFRTEMQQRGSALGAQAASTTLADQAKAKLKMFISHFFQVFNLGIAREVYTADQRAHFQLDVNSEDVPPLLTEQDLALWGSRIVNGDAARVAAGGAAMANPTATHVGTEHTAFVAAQGAQSTLKDTYDHEQEDVAALRPEADDIIADVWDEVEFTFRKEAASSKRRKCREYGVVYRPRAGETLSPDEFSITGTITDSATNAPIADVVVHIAEPDIFVLTDSQGRYYIGVLDPGSYTVQTHKFGYEDTDQPGVQVTATAVTTFNIQLIANPAGFGTVSGQVLVGSAVQPATVTVVGTSLSTTTDPGGNYTLINVPAGSQAITATETGNPANFETQNTNVPVGGSVTVNFNL